MSKPVAEAEVSRILAIVPWILDHPGVSKDELTERFGLTREQLEADLRLVLMIGVPPYTPAEYVEVDAEGDEVTIRLADFFRRPLRLTPDEGLALLAAGRALLAVPGSDPKGSLATALDKLDAALGRPEVSVDVGPPPALAVLRTAVETHTAVDVEYFSAGRGERTQRRIEPHAVFYALGAWYASAYCHRARDQRTFRLDRVLSVRPTPTTFAPPEPAGGEVFAPAPGDLRVTLRLPRRAAWVCEAYPVDEVVDDGEALLVTLPVSERAWLERLVLRVGPGAEVVAPDEWRAVPAAAARRVLARYESP